MKLYLAHLEHCLPADVTLAKLKAVALLLSGGAT